MSEQEEVSRPDEDIKETHLSGVSSGSPAKALRKQIEDKKMTEVNGDIGYCVKKGTQFIPTTNFFVTCIGYVNENSQNNCPDGFLFNMVQKTTILQEDDDDYQLQKR